MIKIVFVAVGVLLIWFGFHTQHSLLISLLGLGVALVGFRISPPGTATDAKISKPPVPAGFAADYWNKNIALDAAAKSLWVRDQDGSTAVLTADQIVRWEASASVAQHQTNIGPRTVYQDPVIRITTRDLKKPLWTIRFNAHFSKSMRGTGANHKEMKDWDGRLTAAFGA